MSPPSSRRGSQARDRVLLAAVVLVAFAAFALAQSRMDPRLLTWEAVDTWFEADAPRVYDNLTERWSNFRRTTTHPLFPTLAYTPNAVLTDLFGMEDRRAAFLYTAALGAIWAGLMFVFLRLSGCRRFDAVVFTALASITASSLCFHTIPETFGWGSISIVTALCLAARANRVPVRWPWAFLACVFTWGTTLTNVMVAAMASVVRRGFKPAALITIASLAFVYAYWGLQTLVFPSSEIPFGQITQKGPLLTPESRGAWVVMRSFFFHSTVMPAPYVVDRPGAAKWPILLVQSSSIGSGGTLAVIGTVLWVTLFLSGLWAAAKRVVDRPLCLVLVGSLVGQVAVSIVYGKETFLYSLHFVPIMIGIAALGTGTSLRKPVLALALLMLPILGFNNISLFARSASFMTDHPELHHDLGKALDERPDDPWPRRESVQLAWPASRGFFLGWHALGGSFSPGFDTFTISIWVLDEDGRIVATGDDLARSDIREEQHVPDPDEPALSIQTETPYYTATWTALAPRRFRLELEPREGEHHLALAVRGVGAQPGPLRRLERTEEGILANGRFALEAQPRAKIHVGIEGEPGWLGAETGAERVESPGGWCWARVELAPGPAVVEVADLVQTGFVDTYLFEIGTDDD